MSDDVQNSGLKFGLVSRIIEQLEPLTAEDREHVMRTVATWFRVKISPTSETHSSSPLQETHAVTPPREAKPSEDEKFSNRSVLSLKDFIFEKDPRTEAERLACLAYYLTHYMETPQFKTVDLTRLNTEAAQRTFSNPAVASNNAIRDGFFVSASKAGYKQLSAMGERFVHALPNREEAQQIKQRMATRRSKKGGNNQGGTEEAEAVSRES